MKKQTNSVAPRGAGYTIIEVMIFLAVSGFIMVAAMNLIRGKQSETYFNQKMRDTQSQLQSWISASSSGYTGADPTKQSCTISGRPVVKNNPPGMGYTPQCVFLGEAIQFPPDNAKGSTLYAFPVFGVRINASTNSLPTDLNSSMPTPIAGQGGNVDLTQPFSLLPMYVKSVKSTGLDSSDHTSSITASHLIGFYGSINTDSQLDAGNGQSDQNAYQYNCGGNTAPGGQCNSSGSTVINCLEMSPSCGFSPTSSYPDKLTSLTVCMTDGTHFAQILITSSNGIGADVTINYPDSLANC